MLTKRQTEDLIGVEMVIVHFHNSFLEFNDILNF